MAQEDTHKIGHTDILFLLYKLYDFFVKNYILIINILINVSMACEDGDGKVYLRFEWGACRREHHKIERYLW